MPRRPPVGLPLAALLLTAACGSGTPAPAAVPPVEGLSGPSMERCRAFTAALPDEIGEGIGKRATEPTSQSTAAWGDPAIALRCGVPSGSKRDDPYEFNDVRWAMHDTGASRTWTTLDREVNVSLEVPDSYDGQAELVGKVSFTVTARLS